MARDPHGDGTVNYSPFPVENILQLLLDAIQIEERDTTSDDAESCERRVAGLLYILGHCVAPTKDTSVGGAPMSRTLQKAYRLPDYLLEDVDGYVEAKYRSRPHKLYESDLEASVDVDPPVKSLPVGIGAMDDYVERANAHDTTVYLVVWDDRHDNIVYAEVSALDGKHLATDEIKGDNVYCYDYDDFEPVSPFAAPLDIN